MAIRFVCLCGQPLKAGDAMAGRGTMCPECGSPVRVPPSSTKPARPSRPAASPESTTAASRSTRSNNPTIKLRRLPHWYQLLRRPRSRLWSSGAIYVFFLVPVTLGLTLVLTALTGTLLLLLPKAMGTAANASTMCGLCAILAAGIAFVFGYIAILLNRVLDSAAAGSTEGIVWPSFSLNDIVENFSRWAGCCLAGPSLLFGACLGYWIQCGAMTVWDWLILLELAAAGMGYWMLALISTGKYGVRGLNPIRVFRMMIILGAGFVKALSIASILTIGAASLVVVVISLLPSRPILGFLILSVVWGGGLCLVMVLLRRLGTAFYEADRNIPRLLREATRPAESHEPPGLELGPIAAQAQSTVAPIGLRKN